MAILVTGGAGFIGSNICEFLLDKGYSVRCFDNLSTGKIENIVDFLFWKQGVIFAKPISFSLKWVNFIFW